MLASNTDSFLAVSVLIPSSVSGEASEPVTPETAGPKEEIAQSRTDIKIIYKISNDWSM